MAIKRVILHLGMTKTGSTSIQHTLFKNSSLLEKNGFRYLTEWGENHYLILHHMFSPIHASHLEINSYGKTLTNEERENLIKTKCDMMLNVINTTECETLIISGEYDWDLIYDSTIAKIKFFYEQYFKLIDINIFIILFIRTPLDWYISSLQQDLYTGSYRKTIDYFEDKTKQYQGLVNIQKNFSDSLVLIKFEDAITHKNGLLGYFLESIGFPASKIEYLNITKRNESNCMEVMEFIRYINDKEPLIPSDMNESINKNRKLYGYDLLPLRSIKGAKFDLPYEYKLALWERLKETVCMLKNSIGIDYTGYKVLPQAGQETYGEETIQGFIEAFPKLTPILQKLFLDFFRNKYIETLHVKFKRLYFEGSIPRKIYALHEETKKLSDEKTGLLEENKKLLAETEEFAEKCSRLTDENAQLATSLKQAQFEKNTMLNSRSWYITKPLRILKALFKKVV